ncbi:hypothetical protein Rsub_02114 [Raphidocelis subcapitata]|uniref:Uncharacterized protein n=1 Tax=Raphidocelis subcapitata TaxID=307507 RepID=A0A2V0NWC0_9CHLO|nr:hypothetical protein Rsub_02114 [Raphidocelis subcapitata]|eukprot:GBF89237.1 hypothetical protein Rsub_02114 [Raphidocelis subcapitata]
MQPQHGFRMGIIQESVSLAYSGDAAAAEARLAGAVAPATAPTQPAPAGAERFGWLPSRRFGFDAAERADAHAVGSSVPSERCPGVLTCVRPGVKCPPRTEDVPFWCPSSDAMIDACAKHVYSPPPAPRPKGAPCRGVEYKDFFGRWRCEGEWREPCRDGYAASSGDTTCSQTCPPWLLDCGAFCASRHEGCNAAPCDLCSMGALTSCSLAERSQSLLSTACVAEGHRSGARCPLSLVMHGGCGGSRLMLASGLRAQGNVVRLEVWWEGGGGSHHQHQQLQHQPQPQQQGQGQQGPIPLSAYLPHTQMPELAAPRDTVLSAVRLTFARGLSQVIGSEAAASAASPRAAYSFRDGEALSGLTIWGGSALDGASATPLVGGFSFTTSMRGVFIAGAPPEPLAPEAAQVVAAAAAAPIMAGPRGREGSGAAAAGPRPDLSGLLGGANATASGSRLGAGILVGAGGFTSGRAVNALGFVFLRGGRDEL